MNNGGIKMKSELVRKFKELKIDKSWIGLSPEENAEYFCTPVDADIIGWDNGIHYCFIPDFDEMVFAVNPETCTDTYVYPLAHNFKDFLSLILTVKGTNTLQQIIYWNKQQYNDFINSEEEVEFTSKKEVSVVLDTIHKELNIEMIEDPFEYVKNVQKDFPYHEICFKDEFYEITGIEKD